MYVRAQTAKKKKVMPSLCSVVSENFHLCVFECSCLSGHIRSVYCISLSLVNTATAYVTV